MKQSVTSFRYEKRDYEERRGKDEENVRAKVTLRDPALGRRLCTGDVDPKAPFPGTPLSTSYLVSGDVCRDRAARRAAVMRLAKKAEPYYTKKTTAKELYDRFFPGFLNSTSVRVPESSRWSMETISQNAKLAKRYLEEIYDKINLPPEEAEGDLLWRLLFLAAKSEDQFGKLVNLNGQFMEYVEQHHGISVPALGGAEPVMPGMGQRMDRSGALPQDFCTRLLENLLEQMENQTPLAGAALGLLAILFMGLRSREVLALSLGELCRELCRVKLSQGKGTSRKIPVVSLLQETASRRVQTLCRQQGIPREKAMTYPVAGAANNASCRMGQVDFAAEAREIFRTLGVQDETIAVYSRMLAFVKARTAEQELSVCAYILRREFVNRLYNRTELPQEMIRYLADTGHFAPKPHLPDGGELREARLALEHSWQAQGGAL